MATLEKLSFSGGISCSVCDSVGNVGVGGWKALLSFKCVLSSWSINWRNVLALSHIPSLSSHALLINTPTPLQLNEPFFHQDHNTSFILVM